MKYYITVSAAGPAHGPPQWLSSVVCGVRCVDKVRLRRVYSKTIVDDAWLNRQFVMGCSYQKMSSSDYCVLMALVVMR